MISEQDQVPLDLLICELHRVLIQHRGVQRLVTQRLIIQGQTVALSVMMRALRSMERHGPVGEI